MGKWTGALRHCLSGLVALLLSGSVVALPGRHSQGATAPEIQVPPRPDDELTEMRSRDGLLDVTFVARAEKVRIGALELDGMTFNGNYAGPVLRLHPGDLLRVHLVNQLTEPANLHFHGIHSSPLGNGDNIHISVPAGASFTYEIHIPADQPTGLNWYHSHVHGLSEHQVMGGLSGALMIDPPESPAASAPPERLFVLKDMTFDDDTGDDRIDGDLHGIVQSINGRLDTNVAMRPGAAQLWRLSNQSANLPFHLALEGHRFRVVAADSQRVIGERFEDVLDIMPAGRFDVVVEGGAAGRYALLSKGTMTGTGAARARDRVLGHLDVDGAAAPATAPVAVEAPPPDLRAAHIDRSRTVAFTQTNTLKASAQRFFINGKLFDSARVDFQVPLGSVEEWTVRNDSDDMHVFHIHQIAFQVMAVNGETMPFTGRVDTVRVPERGSVTLRLPFTDPLILGRFMFHCHVLKHEDRGMMGQIEVFDPRPPPLTARARLLYLHLWWWWHGVPWAACGLSDA